MNDDDLRKKLLELRASLATKNWGMWEKDFIKDICRKLALEKVTMSIKQYDIVCELWRRL